MKELKSFDKLRLYEDFTNSRQQIDCKNSRTFFRVNLSPLNLVWHTEIKDKKELDNFYQNIAMTEIRTPPKTISFMHAYTTKSTCVMVVSVLRHITGSESS